MLRSPTPSSRKLSRTSTLLGEQGVARSVSFAGDSQPASPGGTQTDFAGGLNNFGSSLNISLGSSLRSALGGGGKQSLSRARSEGFLCGVSSSAEYLNSMQETNLSVLVQGGGRGKYALSPTRADNPNMPAGWRGTELDEQDFVRNTDRLVNSITDLRSRHEAFEAMGSPLTRRRRSSTGGNIAIFSKDLSEGATQEEQEKAERLAERLEAYKMVRRVEGEIPQLPPLSSLPPIKKDPVDETIIKRNASSNTIQLSSPSKRKEMIQIRREVLGQRTSMAAHTREEYLGQLKAHFSESLLRKRMQGERITQARVEPAKKVAQQAASLPESWFKICILAVSIKHLAEEVHIGRMPAEERMLYVGKRQNKRRSSCVTNPFVAQAIFLSEIMADDRSQWKLQFVAAMVRSKLKLQQARQDAHVVFDCLQSWQVAGRCFKAFKALADRVVMLQRWWRKCMKHLHEVRDQVSRRWEKLERSQLVQELNRATPLPQRPSKGAGAQPKLSLEDKIDSEKVEEHIRLRFIENELRIRRYKMLPQIQMWEEEVANWRKLYQEWQDTKDAHKALGKPVPTMRIFHWPPVRPSYLPRAHPATEGDEEILNMWRAARKNPAQESLTPMPRRGSCCIDIFQARASRRGAATRATISQDAVGGGGAAASPFGDAADAELKHWGVSAEGMPGLSGGDADGEASGGGPAPQVCSPC